MQFSTRLPKLRTRRLAETALGFLVVSLLPLAAAPPRIGYVYPAGGQQGTTVEIELGGQYLGAPEGAIVSGEGVTVEILEHNKLPAAQVIGDYRDKLRTVRNELKALAKGGPHPESELLPEIEEILAGAELDPKKVRQIDQYTRQRNDPKRQLNSQIGETVRVRITIAPRAEIGLRHLRLNTAQGLSNPVRFVVGRLPELREPPAWKFHLPTYLGIETTSENEEDSSGTPETGGPVSLPVTLNGQILPGELDEFVFSAKEGDQVVVALEARKLVPYLADAVPGWFQSVVSLADTRGRQLAFADDYRFDPDPVLFYKIPRDGEFRLRIHDSIFRGREDFVYRVTIGELPFLTGLSPLGARAGTEVDLKFQGGNLSERERPGFPLPERGGILDIAARGTSGMSNSIAFHVGDLPEDREREDNNRLGAANRLEHPMIVNGSIGYPGDQDFFRFKGTGNQPMTFEIFARRLGSPIDTNLTVYDDDGKQIGWNDDFENPSAGLTTHHADARITVTLPSDGECFVRVADTQNRGGYAYAYRLKVTQGPPDVPLRATPSSLNARAGGNAQLTVHALRLDGYEGPIQLELVDAPPGVSLKSHTIPAGEESAKISLQVPGKPTSKPLELSLRGRIPWDGGPDVLTEVTPAEDMTQAFILKHLVPVDRLLLEVKPAPPATEEP